MRLLELISLCRVALLLCSHRNTTIDVHRSDEGLTLETLTFKLLTVANLRFSRQLITLNYPITSSSYGWLFFTLDSFERFPHRPFSHCIYGWAKISSNFRIFFQVLNYKIWNYFPVSVTRSSNFLGFRTKMREFLLYNHWTGQASHLQYILFFNYIAVSKVASPIGSVASWAF